MPYLLLIALFVLIVLYLLSVTYDDKLSTYEMQEMIERDLLRKNRRKVENSY